MKLLKWITCSFRHNQTNTVGSNLSLSVKAFIAFVLEIYGNINNYGIVITQEVRLKLRERKRDTAFYIRTNVIQVKKLQRLKNKHLLIHMEQNSSSYSDKFSECNVSGSYC